MTIIWFDSNKSYHKIDKLDRALEERGITVQREEVFSKAVAQSGDIAWVECASYLAREASAHELSVPLIIRGSAMEFYRKGFNRIKWENVTRLLVQGEHLGQWVMENWSQTPKEKISVFPSAIDTDYFPMRKHPEKNNKIALVSQVHWRKGTQLIPEILQAIPENYRIYQIGGIVNSDCWNYFTSELRRLKLKDRYLYEGTTGNVPQWLQDKAHFILPTYTEGLPRACGEAMSMGLRPMIHHYRGAGKQWPEEYIWHSPWDIARMLTTKYEPEKYRNFIVENRSLGVVAEMAEKLFEEVLNEKS